MRLLIALIALLLAASSTPEARDLGQYAQADGATRDWFRSRTNRNGVNCCDIADGSRLEDPEWDCADEDHCRVRLDGQWREVPLAAIIKGKSLVGYAVVWLAMDRLTIVCFQPGSRA